MTDRQSRPASSYELEQPAFKLLDVIRERVRAGDLQPAGSAETVERVRALARESMQAADADEIAEIVRAFLAEEAERIEERLAAERSGRRGIVARKGRSGMGPNSGSAPAEARGTERIQ